MKDEIFSSASFNYNLKSIISFCKKEYFFLLNEKYKNLESKDIIHYYLLCREVQFLWLVI